MKTKSTSKQCRFQFKILPYGNVYYPDRIAELQAVLDKMPDRLDIELVGRGEITADTALAIRSVLMERSPETRIIMHARSSLVNGSVLVWLLGDERTIREDARLYFRGANSTDDELWSDSGARYKDSVSGMDLEEIDHARVLELIDEFLPVKELAGQQIRPPELRQFGLVENEEMDQFLATAMGSKGETAEEPDRQQLRSPTNTPQD